MCPRDGNETILKKSKYVTGHGYSKISEWGKILMGELGIGLTADGVLHYRNKHLSWALGRLSLQQNS